MARLNWDRVRAENIAQRRYVVDDDDSVKIVRETYASRLEAKGREYFEITSNKIVAEFLGCNPGRASNVRREVARKNGWELPIVRTEESSIRESNPRQIKNKNSLPQKTEAWIKAQLNIEPDDDFPKEFGPDDLFNLPAVYNDSSAWNRHILLKLGGLNSESAVSLRQWAGRPLTLAQADQEAELQAKLEKVNRQKKVIALLYKAAAEADSGLKFSILKLVEEVENMNV